MTFAPLDIVMFTRTSFVVDVAGEPRGRETRNQRNQRWSRKTSPRTVLPWTIFNIAISPEVRVGYGGYILHREGTLEDLVGSESSLHFPLQGSEHDLLGIR